MINSSAIPLECPKTPVIMEKKDQIRIRSDLMSILTKINYDIDSKSIKGWIRIFNSQEKLHDYEIYISDFKRKEILWYLKYKLYNKEQKYKREIK